MIRIVRKNGNSAMITLTPAAMEELQLKAGDKVDVRARDEKIIITKVKEGK
jgi:antitoxin component of MazEF toxin-antitoxin module